MLQYNPSISGSLSVTGSLIVTNGMIGTVSGVDVQIFSSSINQVITGIQAATGSQEGRLGSIESFTSSTSARLNSIETTSASVDTLNNTQNARLSALETTSASVDTLNIAQNTRLTSLEEKTGSLASTGSNTFYGTQTFSGSVYVKENLIVQGSSSLQNITASAVDIGTNKIILNVNNPAVRYAGISVYDSGSTSGTGSLFWDSVDNHWLYEHPADSGAPYNSAILISGPKNEGNLGEELDLVSNFIVKAVGGDHISSSAIYDDGTTIKLLSNTEVTGSLKITGSINTGHGRFKEWYTTGTGLALEVGVSSNIGNVLTFDRTLSRYYPLQLSGGDGTGGNASYIQITTSGVGIGSPTPEQKLDVRGNFLLKGDNTDGGILTITRRYTNGPQTINFNNNHPDTNLDWTGARITSADAGNYNGYLDFAVSQGNNGSEAAGTAAVASIMRLTKDGRVGIGTTTPQASLHITAKADTTALMIGAGNGYEIFITGSDSANIYHATANQAIYLNTNGGLLHLGTSAGSTFLTVSGSRVGIGSTNPSSIFQVASAQSLASIRSTTTTNYAEVQIENTTNYLQVGVEGATGNRMGGTIAYNSYLGSYANYGMTFHTNNLNRMTITNAGNVGIGSTNPSASLHVTAPFSLNSEAFRMGWSGVGGMVGTLTSTSGQPYVTYGFYNGNVVIAASTAVGRLHTAGAICISNAAETFRRALLNFGQTGTFSQVKVFFNKSNWGSVTYDIKLASAGGSYHTAGAYYSNPGFSSHVNSINAGNGPTMTLVADSQTGSTQGAIWTFSGATMIHPMVTIDIACGNGYQIDPNDVVVQFS